jgi:arylsulfatase A-like enzyme
MARVISYLVKLAIIVAAFTFIFKPELFGLPGLFNNMTPADAWQKLQSTFQENASSTVFWLVFACCVKLLGILAGVLRWKILLRGQGLKMPFFYMAYLWFMGRAIGLFLPGTLGLDGYRLVESARYTREWVKCTSVVVIEKLIGIIALTFLVAVTFPFGAQALGHYIDVNFALFAVICSILGTAVAVCFIVLLNPRIIQVLLAVLPVPGAIRNLLNKIGVAATAYSGSRWALVLAVVFGLCVHLGTCFMYFGCMMAMRATGMDIRDIFFVAPLIIYGSVVTPTVSGLGVRELVGTVLMGPQAGDATALLVFHLGLWAGEVIPFALSVPLLLFGGRPSREELEEELAELKAHAGVPDVDLHLSDYEIRQYRSKVFGSLFAGILAGLFAGGIIGLAEAGYLQQTQPGLTDMQLFPWGAGVYGVIFAGVALGITGGLLFFYLIFDRFPKGIWTYALAFGGTLGAGAFIIGFWRFYRDILKQTAPTQDQILQVVASAAGIALVGLVVAWVLSFLVARILRVRGVGLIIAGLATYALTIGAGFALANQFQPESKSASFAPDKQAQGPNIFLIAVDTLRADYLKPFNPGAETETPNLQDFSRDAILYAKAFSQASWTKASFGTIFTGMYPECHTATTKTAALPPDAQTVAELLRDGGYYTQGWSNNPNLTSLFGYDQGFVDYVDLKPDYYFGARESSARLSLYEVLRRVRQIVDQKILRRKMVVTEFYQPAPVVKDTVLEWLDEEAPENAPFFAFTHFMDPHDPFMDPDSPQGGYARVRMGTDIDPEIYREPMQQAYRREIELLDRELGAFFNGLKERGLYDNSIIILTADHGEEFCEHGGWWHGLTLYQEQTHIPMLIKLPNNVRGGTRNNFMARNLDLAPTILQYAGMPPGEMMQGQSLLDPNNNDTNGIIKYVYAENDFEGIVLQSVQTENAKVITANEENKRGLEPVEFYDLMQDPGEQENRTGDPGYAALEEDLLKQRDQFLNICEEGAIDPATASEASPELNEQLEALGYL